MIKLFDTHAHLNFKDFYEDIDQVIKRSFDNGMEGIINVGSRYDNSELAVRQAEENEKIYAAIGFHPDHLKEIEEQDVPTIINKFADLAKNPNVVAIGEIGFDNFYFRQGINEDTPKNRAKEKLIVESFTDLAIRNNKPIIVHSREAEVELVDFLRKYSSKLPKSGVIHCFTYPWDIAESVLDLGFYIGFNGIITYPKVDELLDTVKKVPLDKILIETDAPLLAPQAMRGQKNEPLYVLEVAKKIADIKGITIDEVAEATCSNAKHLFDIK